MEKDLSTAELESAVFDLSTLLSNSEWEDEVKDSYFRFLDEEKHLISNIKWLTDKANSVYHHVTSVDIGKFKSTYSEYLAKFERLKRGN